MGLEGYILYLAMIFAPGVGFGELLGLWRPNSFLVERFAMAFGLGLGVDTVVLMIRTSGLSIGGLSLVGIDFGTLYAIILFGILAFFLSILIRRKVFFPTKPTRSDFAIFAIMAVQVVILLLYFQKYPIFPAFTSDDFHSHVLLAEDLLSGIVQYNGAGGVDYYYPIGGILYGGVHYQLASSFQFVNGEDLIVAQKTMAILAVLSSPLIYLAAFKITASRKAAVITTLIYALSATVWFTTIFDSGLYADFFGILASLFLIVAIALTISEPKGVSSWIVLVIATINLYMSHYSSLTLLLAIILLPIIQIVIIKKNRWTEVRPYLISSIIILIPAIVGVILFPTLIQLLVSLRGAGGQASLSGSTTLSNFISRVPFLQYIDIQLNNDLAFIVLLILSTVYLYRALEIQKPMLSVPVVWFFSLWIAAGGGQDAWRFSIEALVPLTIMAGFAIASLIPNRQGEKDRRKIQNTISNSWKAIAVLVICVGPILIGSWAQTVVSDSLTNVNLSAQSQSDVYNAIYWLNQNTPANNSGYLSVSDWRFTYSDVLTGQVIDYANVTTTPEAAIQMANIDGDNYIIVTNVVTYQVPLNPSQYPWNYFPGPYAANVTLIYSNPDVKIYNVTNIVG